MDPAESQIERLVHAEESGQPLACVVCQGAQDFTNRVDGQKEGSGPPDASWRVGGEPRNEPGTLEPSQLGEEERQSADADQPGENEQGRPDDHRSKTRSGVGSLITCPAHAQQAITNVMATAATA